jgi:DNA polymerase sigma
VIPLVDQIQVDKRLSGNFNQHEFVFHCTIGSQLIAVQ